MSSRNMAKSFKEIVREVKYMDNMGDIYYILLCQLKIINTEITIPSLNIFNIF